MICIVDRIEETTAVCQREDRSVFTLPLSCLPQGVKEGDVLREENGVFKKAHFPASRLPPRRSASCVACPETSMTSAVESTVITA